MATRIPLVFEFAGAGGLAADVGSVGTGVGTGVVVGVLPPTPGVDGVVSATRTSFNAATTGLGLRSLW